MPRPTSVYFVSAAKNAMFGSTSEWISGARIPERVPGLPLTKSVKFPTKFGSANLFKPERRNSMPSAAWIRAEAARAVLPLAGNRRIRAVCAGRVTDCLKASITFLMPFHSYLCPFSQSSAPYRSGARP